MGVREVMKLGAVFVGLRIGPVDRILWKKKKESNNAEPKNMYIYFYIKKKKVMFLPVP